LVLLANDEEVDTSPIIDHHIYDFAQRLPFLDDDPRSHDGAGPPHISAICSFPPLFTDSLLREGRQHAG
jgi:hypothetical protein